MRHDRSVIAVGLVIAAATILTGGLFASNMGFKLEYPLKAASISASKSGFNTLALPYNRQIGVDTARALFRDINDAGSPQNIQKFLPESDTFQVYSYGHVNFGLEQGVGYFVKMGSTANYVVVGSHDPSAAIQLREAGAGSKSGNNLFAPPYHTTAATAKDLFREITGVQNIQKFLPLSDTTQLYSYGSADFAIVPGEAYFVKMGSDLSYTPSHY